MNCNVDATGKKRYIKASGKNSLNAHFIQWSDQVDIAFAFYVNKFGGKSFRFQQLLNSGRLPDCELTFPGTDPDYFSHTCLICCGAHEFIDRLNILASACVMPAHFNG